MIIGNINLINHKGKNTTTTLKDGSKIYDCLIEKLCQIRYSSIVITYIKDNNKYWIPEKDIKGIEIND